MDKLVEDKPLYYDVEVIGPTPQDGHEYVLIVYDRLSPFQLGFTTYSVDYLDTSNEKTVKGYTHDGGLALEFSNTFNYVLIDRDSVRLVEQKHDKAGEQVAIELDEDHEKHSKGYM